MALVLARTTFETFEAVLNLALKVDNEVNGANTTTTSTTATPDPNTMDLSVFRGQMSEGERNQMRRAGLCFRCAKQGHLLRNCPIKGKGKPATACISELEEELKRLKGRKGSGREDLLKNGGNRE
ncbi:hypothetical protein PCANC_13285 [Puccinia coronata f. sp. avenae]|uniref:CCHC-type domain-containing protein n=1 Tax=Puccinia coronata f. sp. avenae TaxID=200324 RepID=A0A2N5SPG8_9BASI|nr:hypothetical protein PCANC_13285 [Puccinia coronata f. sp. avenae]